MFGAKTIGVDTAENGPKGERIPEWCPPKLQSVEANSTRSVGWTLGSAMDETARRPKDMFEVAENAVHT